MTIRAVLVCTSWYKLVEFSTYCPNKKQNKKVFHDDQCCPSWYKLVQISKIQYMSTRAVQVSTNWYNLVQFSTCCPKKKGIS